MKKLMIAAIMAGAVGATFADCEVGTVCAYAYRLKLAGKTVKALSKTTGSEATCDLDANCWAKATSLRIAGYLYNPGTEGEECDCTCDANTLLGGGEFAFHFWDQNKKEVVFDAVTIDLAEILRSSGEKNKAQILIKMDDLNLAGFGVFNPKTLKLKRASGFFAGKLPPAQCWADQDGDCVLDGSPSMIFKPYTIDTAEESAGAIAFGRWNLAYKADKVAALQTPGVGVAALYPAKFQAAAEEP